MPRLKWLALAALMVCAPAQSAWYRASSPHFIIYSEQDPARLRQFAAKLERFDKAVRVVRTMRDQPVGDGNRLTVFVVRNESTVRKLADDKTGFTAGFYIARASGSTAFVPQRADIDSDWDLGAETIFFHEYAHHLMLQELSSPAPEWLVEGFAEFMSTVRFEKDGSVGLGQAPRHRAYSLSEASALSIEELLGGSYDKITDEQRESIYGRGWLLSHYLTFEHSRKGQLDAYLLGIGQGRDPLESARAAFGDLKKLNRDIESYLRRPRLSYLRISATEMGTPPIQIAPVSAGAAAMLPLHMQLQVADTSKSVEPLASQIRKVAAAFPGDGLVEATLAEAEIRTGRYDAAEAAANRALTANPRDGAAMVLKGRALIERGISSTKDEKSMFAAARKLFIAANKLDPEDPEPLLEFHASFAREGVRPTDNAVAALHYASNLAPQDSGLRMNSAMQYLVDGKLAEARSTLAPIAYDPHGRKAATAARSMMAKIDARDAEGALKVAEAANKQRDE